MTTISKIAAGAVLATGLALAGAPARAADQMTILNQSMITVERMKSDPTFGPSHQLLRDSMAVLIVPQLLKGGFMVGGEGGQGVLLQRIGRRWSSPAFYTLGSASFGLQIGIEEARLVMFIRTERALRAIEQSKFTFGGAAGLTVITLGANARAATSTNLTGDIIVWASSKGAYGGLTLEGSVLAPDTRADAQFYGRPASVPQILGDAVGNPAATPLRRDLATL